MTDTRTPCRTTQHCAHHGWCHRCAPDFAATMTRVNIAIQRTDPVESHWGPLYEAVAGALLGVLPAPVDRATVAHDSDAQDDVAHPPHDGWLVEWRAEGGDWAVAYPTHDRGKALDRMVRGRQEAPEWQWRLVRETTSYAVEEPADDEAREEVNRA